MKKLVYSFLDTLKKDAQENQSEFLKQIQEAIDIISMVYDLDMDSETDREDYLLKNPSLIELTSGETPTIGVEENLQKAEELKLEGNNAVQQKKYRLALSKYNEAIKYSRNNAILYSNRAAAHIGVNDYESAIEDCKMALEIDPSYERAKIRLQNAEAKLRKLGPANKNEKGGKSKSEMPGDLNSVIQELMKNPAMAKMTESMLGKKNIQELSKNIDPKILETLSRSIGK